MKRSILLSLVTIVIGTSLVALLLRVTIFSSVPQVVHSHLARTPRSTATYELCIEAFAFAFAQPDNPYKTDYTFHDPFRNADDTIIPRLMSLDKHDRTVTFLVTIIVGQVATFTESISHVSALDAISVMLPDKDNHLQRASEPQFIISFLSKSGGMAILDFTCSAQWKWKVVAGT